MPSQSPFETREDVVTWGLERGLLIHGEKPEVIIKRVNDMEQRLGYSSFKAEALRVILDSLDRKKRGKHPATTGSFKSDSDLSYPSSSAKESRNPREYLEMVLDEFAAQVALETRFIADFVEGNDKLDEEAKRFLIKIVSTHVGPWYAPGHVTSVRQENDGVIVQHKNGEAHYYRRK